MRSILFHSSSQKMALCILWTVFLSANIFSAQAIEIQQKRFMSVRFDPSYYYNREESREKLCRDQAVLWRQSGMNAVYIKVYDPVYGAVYKTRYAPNIETDFGRKNFLRTFIDACHGEELQVYAWIPAYQHKQVWEMHPDWRVKRHGSDYKPGPDSYLLCVRNPDYREWYAGFLNELLKNYPDLDGVDIAEPVVIWTAGEGCYCDMCRPDVSALSARQGMDQKRAYELERSRPLTSILEQASARIHEAGMNLSITTVMTSRSNGILLTPEEQRSLSGFDLNGILNSRNKPDIINAELIWQQWAGQFQNTVLFTPEWSRMASARVLDQVRNRAQVIIHIELTPLSGVEVSGEQFVQSFQSSLEAGPAGIDFYDSHQADRLGLWPRIQEVSKFIPLKRVAVLYESNGENDARHIEVLLRHFRTEVTLIPVEQRFIPDMAGKADFIFYLGTEYRESLPEAFLSFLFDSRHTVCWLGENIQLLADLSEEKLGFLFEQTSESKKYDIFYQKRSFTKMDLLLQIIRVTDSNICQVKATAGSSEQEVPYAVQSGSFWYFADIPIDYVVEGGRHIVFADLLHEILREDHTEKHHALVRIEDVNPMSDPASLKKIANFLHSRHIPFAVGLTPFYLDPSANTTVALSDQPELVEALRYAVSRGGNIVLHGYTHQYRGQTTDDYEFWDRINDSPVFQDSEDYIRNRIEIALSECYQNRLYPIMWETPHYAASQLDYGVFDTYFSTAYERRQTMDETGTDQLLPFFIPSKDGKAQLVPENLGYVPLNNPSAESVMNLAMNNLSVRDGFASFFFHPFVPIDVLKQIVKEIQSLGYMFCDVRELDNRVTADNHITLTGQGTYSLELKDQYFREMYLDNRGKDKNKKISDNRVNEIFTREITCPDGWLYLAGGLDVLQPQFPANLWHSFRKSRTKVNFWEQGPLEAAVPPVIPLIILDNKATGEMLTDQRSLINAFQSVGIDYQTADVKDFFNIPEAVNLIVVPLSAALQLSEQQELFLIDALSGGVHLILEKPSDLSMRLGIVPSDEVKEIGKVVDEYYPQVEMIWKSSDTYQTVDVPVEYVTFYSEKESGDPVVIGGEYGEGKYLYFATLFDPLTGLGYSRYPYFCDLIQRQFDLWPLVRRESAEVYFEPGDREDVSIEELVKSWKKNGFRTIYAAGWHTYTEWTYDYALLIRLAHENAMTVYLWLELPHVNIRFWEEHPEWREITATGEEAVIDWRSHMALYIPECKEAAFQEISRMIQDFDWDGINLAELYFESPLGPENPRQFTPMHPYMRGSFRKMQGFDPKVLFDRNSSYFWKRNPGSWGRFEQYRRDLVFELHRDFLAFLQRELCNKGTDLEIMVTGIDDRFARKTGRGIGMDMQRLIGLKKEYPFTLQIEDPQELWHLGPDRYRMLSDAYQRLSDGSDIILDVNIVPFRDWDLSLAPTQQPSGLEFYQLMKSAGEDGNRVALYSESSIYEVDLPWISYVYGAYTREKVNPDSWEILSDRTVTVDLNYDVHKNIAVNNRLWPAYFRGNLLLPSGNHEIKPMNSNGKLFNSLKSTTKLIDLSGELIDCSTLSRGIQIEYNSSFRNYLLINEEPLEVILDDESYEAEIFHGISGYALKMPSGRHSVRIMTRNSIALPVKNFSLVTSLLIVSLSSVAGLSLITLYTIRFIRRKRARRNNI